MQPLAGHIKSCSGLHSSGEVDLDKVAHVVTQWSRVQNFDSTFTPFQHQISTSEIPPHIQCPLRVRENPAHSRMNRQLAKDDGKCLGRFLMQTSGWPDYTRSSSRLHRF